MNQQNTPIHVIGFYSSTTGSIPYHPGIVVTDKPDENGKYPCAFFTKVFSHLEAVKNWSDEQLIQILENEGFRDIEFFMSNGWLGFKYLYK